MGVALAPALAKQSILVVNVALSKLSVIRAESGYESTWTTTTTRSTDLFQSGFRFGQEQPETFVCLGAVWPLAVRSTQVINAKP